MSDAAAGGPQPEWWLRGPIPGVPDELQPAAHALLQGRDELARAGESLSPDELWARPAGVASVGFHLRHAAGVVDRLLTYAAGAPLAPHQLAALAAERDAGDPPATAGELVAALAAAVDDAIARYRATDPATLGEPRRVGRAGLPATMRGLLFHAAEHVQRHAGQALTTAAIVRATRDAARAAR